MLAIQIITLIILIVLSGFFSGSETALMSLNKVKIKSLVKKGNAGAEAVHRLKQNPRRLIIAILIGNNFVNISAASLATITFTEIFGSSGAGIATGVMTFLILVFGEITPKTFATQNAERISLFVARPLEIFSIIISPLISLFEYISGLTNNLFGSQKDNGLSEEELRTIVTMGAEEGLLNKETAEIMQNVLTFKDTHVTDIMTPDIDILMLDGEKNIESVIEFITDAPFSKYPVYLKNRDNIIGILDVDDVLICIKNKKLNTLVKDIVRKTLFVPETKEIDDLLTEFEKKKIGIAIVVDEYGNVAGLVTIQDILEEIVGDIFDKSQKDRLGIQRLDAHSIQIDAKAPLEELKKTINIDLTGKAFNTIAGFIEHQLGRIPKKGEKIDIRNATIEIIDATRQKIKSVKITKH